MCACPVFAHCTICWQRLVLLHSQPNLLVSLSKSNAGYSGYYCDPAISKKKDQVL